MLLPCPFSHFTFIGSRKGLEGCRFEDCETDCAVSGWENGIAGGAAADGAAGRDPGTVDAFGDQSGDGEDEGGAGENEPAPEGEGASGPGAEGDGGGAKHGLEKRAGKGAESAGVAESAGLQRGGGGGGGGCGEWTVPGG